MNDGFVLRVFACPTFRSCDAHAGVAANTSAMARMRRRVAAVVFKGNPSFETIGVEKKRPFLAGGLKQRLSHASSRGENDSMTLHGSRDQRAVPSRLNGQFAIVRYSDPPGARFDASSDKRSARQRIGPTTPR